MKEEIVEGNKLIAEFVKYDYLNDETEEMGNGLSFIPGRPMTAEDLDYHTNWNHLMPVVWKIDGLSKEWPRTTEPLWSLPITAPIEKVWKECVIIAKWHNENQPA